MRKLLLGSVVAVALLTGCGDDKKESTQANQATPEIKKEETSFGPPMEIRLSPKELENFIIEFGFKKISYTDLGSFYMVEFEMV